MIYYQPEDAELVNSGAQQVRFAIVVVSVTVFIAVILSWPV
jgi:hypothetical protein